MNNRTGETNEVKINIEDQNNLKIDNITFQKMVLIHNALEDGWTVKKRSSSFIFTKNHEGKKEVLSEEYLLTFMKSNLNMNKLLA